MDIRRNIAFITADTTRTGATILLTRLMKVLKESGASCRVLLKADNGPMSSDFWDVSEWWATYSSKEENMVQLARRKLFRASGRGFGGVFENADVIINNTVGNGTLLHSLRLRNSTLIATYIHELQTMAKMHTDAQSVDYTVKYSDVFLVPSQAVADFLKSEWKITNERIIQLDYYIPMAERTLSRKPKSGRFVVGGCGTVDWRKGIDLFVQTALQFSRSFPDIDCQFVWKGADVNSNFVKHTGFELTKAGCPNLVKFEKADDDMTIFYNSIDLLLLPSREDPYPLVVLEAAAAGVPTVCFERAGGAPEFVGSDCGSVVSYVDVTRMTEAVGNYAKHRDVLKTHGENAFAKVLQKHGDPTRIVEQFKSVMSFSRA